MVREYWMKIKGGIFTHSIQCQWTGCVLERCNYTQHSTSSWRAFIGEFVVYINKCEHHLIHWLRWYGAGFLELRCASRLVLALRRLSAHIQHVVDCKLSIFLHSKGLSSWRLLVTPRLHILYPGNIERECVFFFIYISAVNVDSI